MALTVLEAPHLRPGWVNLKRDARNAFNEVHRQHRRAFMREVAQRVPALYSWVHSLYDGYSLLDFLLEGGELGTLPGGELLTSPCVRRQPTPWQA
jgi:hypothetical protein